MAKQKSKSKPAAGTPQVPRYGELYSFGLYDLDYPAYADEERPLAPIDPEQVALCRRWLELHAKPRMGRMNFRTSSYVLKHNVERWCETFGPHKYVSNGAFIQAAIDLGYRYVQRGQVASFNIEPKSPGLFDWKHQQAVMSAGRAMQKQLANEIK